MPRPGRSPSLASFAHRLTSDTAEAIERAEDVLAAGDEAGFVAALVAAAAALPDGAEGDDDRVALGEAAESAAEGASHAIVPGVFDLIDSLIARTTDHRARGALLYYRGRGQRDEGGSESLRQALAEFTRARDVNGRAVTLAALSWPNDASVPLERRLKLARQAVELAESAGDPWVIANCAGRLGGVLAYSGDLASLRYFERAAELLAASVDPLTVAQAQLNQLNLFLCALMLGDYGQARRVLEDARFLAVGEQWEQRFEGARRLWDWRTGVPPGSGGNPPVHESGTDLTVVAGAAQALESARIAPALATDVVTAAGDSVLLRGIALAVQARIRAIRNEPAPMRGLPGFIAECASKHIRLGWQDALLTYCEHEPDAARAELVRVADLRSDNPRAEACRLACSGLVAGADGHHDLVAAGEAFARLPEPVTAGRLFHRAARTAPTIALGNALRRRAIDLLRAAGADRSLAAVLRDRTLSRGAGYERIPESMARAVDGRLTAREREVAMLAARGLTAAEIADELCVSVWTVRHHLKQVREKLGGVPKRRLVELLG